MKQSNWAEKERLIACLKQCHRTMAVDVCAKAGITEADCEGLSLDELYDILLQHDGDMPVEKLCQSMT